tara:strand:- start:2606 stop:3130 length:525 start_codon:yes stop_codon:yes gene_type:complete
MSEIERVREMSERLKNCAITVDILRYLNDLAIDMEYNRSLNPEFLDETMDTELAMKMDVVADSRFPVVLLMALPHYYKNGHETDMHVRLMLDVVVKSKVGVPLEKEYATVTLDVPVEVINHLPNIPTVRWIDLDADRKEWTKVWDEVDKTKLSEDFIKDFEKYLQEREERDEEE